MENAANKQTKAQKKRNKKKQQQKAAAAMPATPTTTEEEPQPAAIIQEQQVVEEETKTDPVESETGDASIVETTKVDGEDLSQVASTKTDTRNIDDDDNDEVYNDESNSVDVASKLEKTEEALGEEEELKTPDQDDDQKPMVEVVQEEAQVEVDLDAPQREESNEVENGTPSFEEESDLEPKPLLDTPTSAAVTFEKPQQENQDDSQQNEAGYETPPPEEADRTSQIEKESEEEEDIIDCPPPRQDGEEKNSLMKRRLSNSKHTSAEVAQKATREDAEEFLALQDKYGSLMGDNKRLRGKLQKTKAQFESLTQKHNSVHDSLKAMEGKLAQQHEVNLALRNELDEIRRNQDKVDKNEVTGILARVRVAGVGYTLLQENSGKSNAVWHQDQQIVKIQEQLYTDWKNVHCVTYESVLPERQRLEQELESQMQKHQDRLKRLNTVVENQNEAFMANKAQLKEAQASFVKQVEERDKFLAQRDQFFTALANLSNQIRGAIQQVLVEYESFEGAINIIGQSEEHFKKLVHHESDQSAQLMKSQVHELYTRTFKTLLWNNQTSKNKFDEQTEVVTARDQSIQQLTETHQQEVEQLKVHYEERQLQMQAKFNVIKCEKQLISTIDVEHIRNMFISFFNSTEPTVRENTLKVLFKALEVPKEEQEAFKQSAQQAASCTNSSWFGGRFF